jgi:hypothetical protein
VTPNQIRARLAKRTHACRYALPDREKACPGWKVIITPRNNTRLIACVECNELAPARLRVDDKMIRSLSEADAAGRRRTGELLAERRARNTTTHLRTDAATLTPLCGRRPGRTEKGRRRHGWSYRLEDVDCTQCIRLAAMTPEQRAALDAQKNAKLATLRDKKSSEREARIAEDRARVENARADAMMLLDAVLSGTPLAGELYNQLCDTLDTAILAHRLENPRARGANLWKYVAVGQGIGDVRCRFCEELLECNVRIGTRTAGSFSEHCQPCALRFLAREHVPQHNNDTWNAVSAGSEGSVER